MRKLLMLVLVLATGAAFAQTSAPADKGPPTVGGKPLVQVKPGAAAPAAAKSKAASKPTSIAKRLQACLDIDDGTKGRLDCDDAIFAPKPNPKAPAAKGVGDCRFIKEEDARLTCYNGFAESIPKF